MQRVHASPGTLRWLSALGTWMVDATLKLRKSHQHEWTHIDTILMGLSCQNGARMLDLSPGAC